MESIDYDFIVLIAKDGLSDAINKETVRTKMFQTFFAYYEAQIIGEEREPSSDSAVFKYLIHSRLMSNKELLPLHLVDKNDLIMKADEETENLFFQLMLIVDFEANVRRLAEEFSEHDPRLFGPTFKAIEKFYSEVSRVSLRFDKTNDASPTSHLEKMKQIVFEGAVSKDIADKTSLRTKMFKTFLAHCENQYIDEDHEPNQDLRAFQNLIHSKLMPNKELLPEDLLYDIELVKNVYGKPKNLLFQLMLIVEYEVNIRRLAEDFSQHKTGIFGFTFEAIERFYEDISRASLDSEDVPSNGDSQSPTVPDEQELVSQSTITQSTEKCVKNSQAISESQNTNCDQCGKSFLHQTHLLNHKRTVHADSRSSSDDKEEEVSSERAPTNDLKCDLQKICDSTEAAEKSQSEERSRAPIVDNTVSHASLDSLVQDKGDVLKPPVIAVEELGSSYMTVYRNGEQIETYKRVNPVRKCATKPKVANVWRDISDSSDEECSSEHSDHLVPKSAIENGLRTSEESSNDADVNDEFAPPDSERLESINFSNEDYINLHINNIAKKTEKIAHVKFSNDECSKMIDNSVPGRFKCGVCGKGYSSKHNLTVHNRIHTGETPFECDQCGKTFKDPSPFRRHKLLHTGERPYKCEKCGKSYSNVGALHHHKKVALCDPENVAFKCKDCGEDFKKSRSLCHHMRQVHGRKMVECTFDGCSRILVDTPDNVRRHMRLHSAEKPFKCNVCGKGVLSKSKLTKHMRRHTGETPFECDECDKKFRSKWALRTHKNIHTGEKPFKCKQCKKMFARTGSLHYHKRVVHGGQNANETFADVSRASSYLTNEDVSVLSQIATECLGDARLDINEDSQSLYSKRSICETSSREKVIGDVFKSPVIDVEELGSSHLTDVRNGEQVDTFKRVNPVRKCATKSEVARLYRENSDSSDEECSSEHSDYVIPRSAIEDELWTSEEEFPNVANVNGEFAPPVSEILESISVSNEDSMKGLRIDNIEKKTFDIKRSNDASSKMIEKSVPEKFKCGVCDQVLSSKYNLMVHHRRHTGETPFECGDCGRKFKDPSVLKRHKLIHTGERPYKCEKCGKSYSDAGALHHHKKVALCGLKNVTFKCKDCGEDFEKSKSLCHHMRQVHGRKMVECTFEGCSRVLLDSPYLIRRHMIVHSSQEPFKCNVCGKGFLFKSNFRKHMRVHTGETPFECDECGKKFQTKWVLKNHKNLHTGEKPYKCKQCKETFTHPGSLHYHKRVVHDGPNANMSHVDISRASSNITDKDVLPSLQTARPMNTKSVPVRTRRTTDHPGAVTSRRGSFIRKCAKKIADYSERDYSSDEECSKEFSYFVVPTSDVENKLRIRIVKRWK